MENLNVAYIQADLAWESIDENLNRFSEMFAGIQQSVDLVVLPESFNTGFCHRIAELAEAPDGKSTRFLIEKAKKVNAVLTTSLFINEGGKIYNRMMWVRPDGTYDYYDKRHAFLLSEEHTAITRGNKLCTFELKGWRIRPFICYDIRFPVWTRNRYDGSRLEYDLALFIANWPIQRAHAWRTLALARAIENLAYVVVVNRVGIDADKSMYIGDSMAINYKGEILSKATDGLESVNYVTLDYGLLADFRENFRFIKTGMPLSTMNYLLETESNDNQQVTGTMYHYIISITDCRIRYENSL